MTAARYGLERVVGRGRHASVWLARDRERRTQVALKFAPAGSLAAEREALACVAHPHVVGAHASGTWTDGRDFIAMDYAPGCAAALQGRLSPAAASRLLREAAAALAAVHAAGWVHRDVKPAHLLLRGDGSVALADFGSAVRIGAGGASHASAVGTPRYAAPEQTRGASAAPAADVYSLGIAVWEVLTGRPPFGGETLIEIYSQHLRARVPRLPDAWASWQELLDGMLAKDPDERPADGAALLERCMPVTGETM